jgi:hypothetical protein
MLFSNTNISICCLRKLSCFSSLALKTAELDINKSTTIDNHVYINIMLASSIDLQAQTYSQLFNINIPCC